MLKPVLREGKARDEFALRVIRKRGRSLIAQRRRPPPLRADAQYTPHGATAGSRRGGCLGNLIDVDHAVVRCAAEAPGIPCCLWQCHLDPAGGLTCSTELHWHLEEGPSERFETFPSVRD